MVSKGTFVFNIINQYYCNEVDRPYLRFDIVANGDLVFNINSQHHRNEVGRPYLSYEELAITLKWVWEGVDFTFDIIG